MRRFVPGEDFRLVAECFSRVEAARQLGVSLKTLARWCSGARVPWAAYQLLYERSKYGQGERDAAEGFERRMILAERDALRERVAKLEAELVKQAALIDWRCANDPYISPSDPRTKISMLDQTG